LFFPDGCRAGHDNAHRQSTAHGCASLRKYARSAAIHHAYVRHQESSLCSAPHRAQNKKRCFQASAGFFLSGAEWCMPPIDEAMNDIQQSDPNFLPQRPGRRVPA
jgi:hypothetical protein